MRLRMAQKRPQVEEAQGNQMKLVKNHDTTLPNQGNKPTHSILNCISNAHVHMAAGTPITRTKECKDAFHDSFDPNANRFSTSQICLPCHVRKATEVQSLPTHAILVLPERSACRTQSPLWLSSAQHVFFKKLFSYASFPCATLMSISEDWKITADPYAAMWPHPMPRSEVD